MISQKYTVFNAVKRCFDSLDSNNFAVLGRREDPMWESPIIGVAAGDDPYYDFLKEHIGPFHWTPAEAFAQKYGEVPDPGKLRVISIAFPQTAATKIMQMQAGAFPCDNWLVSRGEWEPLIRSFCLLLQNELERNGIRCVCPELLSGMSWKRSEKLGLASSWSQRHTAYAAGLGTFGLSDGLITRKGIAVRFTSMVIEADIPAYGRVSEDPYAWCTRCGACIRRCPADAITAESGHDKEACSAFEDYCVENLWPKHIERGNYIFGCGLCQAGIPCSDRPPVREEITYRQIRPSDNAQLADLVRISLGASGLDIPGTAFFDPCLEDLYAFYQENPRDRYYIVAENPQGRIVGGIGFDRFDRLEDCAELQKLYVAADFRRMRIASRLLLKMEKEAAERGYKRIYLETHSNLQAALRFYERAGYQSIPRPEYAVHETMNQFLIKEMLQ